MTVSLRLGLEEPCPWPFSIPIPVADSRLLFPHLKSGPRSRSHIDSDSDSFGHKTLEACPEIETSDLDEKDKTDKEDKDKNESMVEQLPLNAAARKRCRRLFMQKDPVPTSSIPASSRHLHLQKKNLQKKNPRPTQCPAASSTWQLQKKVLLRKRRPRPTPARSKRSTDSTSSMSFAAPAVCAGPAANENDKDKDKNDIIHPIPPDPMLSLVLQKMRQKRPYPCWQHGM